ncbi:MAG TPA: MBL fold metallo-hydrolase [Chloroflexi bacterium]|jgi:glyoxylase-like metal-dependent hydrolase (beta-lactamase superfamily II)|nr:MBL fold metallo-hydrolase [Chloroflexota bacterium]
MIVHPIYAGFGLSFLLELPHGLYLVDAGSPGWDGRVLAAMRRLGRTDLKLIWITHAHYDHYGSAAALRALTGAKIACHPADAASLEKGLSPLGTTRGRGKIYPFVQPLANRIRTLRPTPPDFTLEDGQTLERFGLDAAVLHTPGHTPGHTCLLLSDGTAFAADLLGGSPPHLQNLLATDWDQLPASLAYLQAARPARAFTGHTARPFPGPVLQSIQA